MMLEVLIYPLPGENSAAMAPGASTTDPAGQGMTGNQNFVTRRDPGVWRASDFMGKDLYGSNNEDIGEVSDVLIDRSGQVRAVVIDVGGFLGLGETQVAVPIQSLQFGSQSNQNVGTTGATSTTTGTTAATTGTTTGAANTATANNSAAPERIILVMTKEQLRSAPKFEDSNRGSAARSTTTAPGATPGTTTAPRQ